MGVFTTTKTYRLGLNLMPQWWISGASIDLDFRNGRYYDSSLATGVQSLAPLNSYLSCSRASTGYVQNSDGTFTSFGNDTLRIGTGVGLLIEDARTNVLLNSDAPATQTTGSLSTGDYTLSVYGSGSALASAGSATITGAASATEGAPDTFTVTGAGTVTVTVTGSLTRFQLEAGSFASSFILTGGASATRAKDLNPLAGALNTIITGTPASIVMDVKFNVPSTDSANYFILGDNSGTNNYLYDDSSGHKRVRSDSPGGGIFYASNSFTHSFSDGVKVGVAYSAGARSLAGDGLAPVTDAFGNFAPPFQVTLGSGNGNSTIFGYIRRLTAWNSKLADATLQSLTAQ